jgi:hypothetical protein
MEIDPIEYNLLLHTLEQLQKENERLKNRLDFVEPKKELFENNNHKKNIDLNDPIEKWNCQHFIRYFLQQYKTAYKKDYIMQPSAWSLEAFKISAFWRRHPNLTKEKFKEIIDWLFETAAENYEIKMGLITSDNQLKNFENFCSKKGKGEYNKVETQEEELKKDVGEQQKVDITSEELKDKLKGSLGKESS